VGKTLPFIKGVYEWIRTQYHVESLLALPVELLPVQQSVGQHLLRLRSQLLKSQLLSQLLSQLQHQPQ
jgi:hypothetical protein